MEFVQDDSSTDEVTAHSVKACPGSLNSFRRNSGNKSVRLWKLALHKVQSVNYLDPWVDFPTHTISTKTVTRHRYSVVRKKWVVDQIEIKMEPAPFDHGAMRECFRMKKIPQSGVHRGDWQHASNYVAKRYLTDVPRQVYFDDVRLQMEAKLWGEAYNRQNPPKKVDIFQLSVLEFDSPVNGTVEEAITSNEKSTYLYHIERFMEGEYRKYNSNSGFVDDQLRNTPHAFSHFTFERSGHRLLVVDIQGVGDLYTDPQIHTADGVGYSDGNLGPRGIAFFFHSHRCNPLCEFLGLTPFDLAPSELDAQDSQQSPPSNGPIDLVSPDGMPFEHPQNDCLKINLNTDKPEDLQRGKQHKISADNISRKPRRRSVSFSQCSSTPCARQFGPTVARSTEDVNLRLTSNSRRRCDSASACSEIAIMSHIDGLLFANNSRANLLVDDHDSSVSVKLDNMRRFDAHLPTRTVPSPHPSLHAVEVGPRPLYALDGARLYMERHRASSGDSGYCPGRVTSLFSPLKDLDSLFANQDQSFFPDHHPNMMSTFDCRSTHSLIDYPVPSLSPTFTKLNASLFRQLSIGGDGHLVTNSSVRNHEYNSHLFNSGSINGCTHGRLAHNSGGGGGGGGLFPRRHRNLSESSDLDADEDHRNAGNLLHLVMHESHKPSCAAHPTNLDQEIGQSILGQIHHELARLHEAGRFLPEKEGGWSLHKTDLSSSSTDTATNLQNSIDWTAVLFHELHAAQLGCLEAMIVMAHYYLGLPTQLLLDCPTKPDPKDVRSGVDYLWRAAEGGDRRCMILLARYLDVSVTLSDPTQKSNLTSCSDGMLVFPTLQSASLDVLPSAPPDAWLEAVTWYQKAVDTAGITSPSDGTPDEGLDAEGRYDAAEDLLPVYKILARMAEIKFVGGYGLKQDYNSAGDLFSQAGELASSARQGRLAAKYFELSEDAYGKVD